MSPASPLAHLSLKDQALFHKLSFGQTRPVQIPVVHHSFQKHALEEPEVVAVEDPSQREFITYRALDVKSNRLARRLRERSILPGSRVCILARRSIALIVGILAVLKSGAQYVPLDAATITDETLEFVLEDSTPGMVLVMEDYLERVSQRSEPVICLEKSITEDELAGFDSSPVEDLSSPLDGAYCIYTSGTTGTSNFLHLFGLMLTDTQADQKA